MRAEILLAGNEGFRITTPEATVFIDAFWGGRRGWGNPVLRPAEVTTASLILVTHNHWDHFGAPDVAEVAQRTGAVVAGPNDVIAELHGKVHAERLLAMEPPAPAGTSPATSIITQRHGITITAFRTFHGRAHISYLVETPSFRWFHDGDNENTRRIEASALGHLDALFIAPWQGSGWVEFVERLDPAHWFIMHMTEEELDQHEAGAFLPDLCDHVPARLIALRPGQSHRFE
jgi:L-ascorbate metabolism protein UlaG (beta-lactamase superfamily)